MSKPLTYKIVRFEATGRFIGIADNYTYGVFIATVPQGSHADAHVALENLVRQMARNETYSGLELRWFDGTYIARKNGDFVQDYELSAEQKASL